MALAIRRLLKRSRSVVIVLTLVSVVLWSFLSNKQSFLIDRYRQQFSAVLRSNTSSAAAASVLVAVDRTTATRSPLGLDSSDPTTNATQAGRRRRKVTIELVGCARLGNHLFGHASMLGLADRHRLDPVISSASKLFLSTFDAGIPSENRAFSGWKTCEEKLPSGYDESVDEKIRLASGADILLFGYFQSWRYFDHIRHRIVRHFRFKPATAEKAAKVIESMTDKYLHRSNLSLVVNGSRSDIVLVGVHVRRGDMIGPSSLEKGYTVASPEYLKRAMALMEDRSSSNGSVAVIYVVVSDDIPWCRVHVTSQRFPVEYVSNSAEVDLAILASCNHTIFTVGSFGWWAAYLAGGLTVYYRDFPANGSQLSKGFRADDYFHPSWVGLS